MRLGNHKGLPLQFSLRQYDKARLFSGILRGVEFLKL